MRISWTLSPKPAADYTLDELLNIKREWGAWKWAAQAINVSVYSFKKAIHNKQHPSQMENE